MLRHPRAMELPCPVLLRDCAPAPNPRRVTAVIREKGLAIPTEQVDIQAGAQFDAHRAEVGIHHVPALRLTDGTWLTESMAIARYLEALVPGPNLMGQGPLEVALVEMWTRRIESELLTPVAAVLRHGNPRMAVMEDQCPAWADASRPRVLKGLRWIDARLSGRDFVALDRFSFADITLAVTLDFMRVTRIAIPADCARLADWQAGMMARPSLAR